MQVDLYNVCKMVVVLRFINIAFAYYLCAF